MMESHDLMKLLIPDKKVNDVAKFTNLTTSILYQERRKSGDSLTDTGTRNTIDRLDLFCEFNLGRNSNVVRLVGERYLQMYENYIASQDDNQKSITVNDLLKQLGEVSRECGEAISTIAGQQHIKNCTVEVAQAKDALEKALQMVKRLQECE